MNIRRGHPRDSPTQAFYKHTHTHMHTHTHTFLTLAWIPKGVIIIKSCDNVTANIHVCRLSSDYQNLARPLFTVYLPVSVLCTTRHLHAGPILHHSTPHSYKMVIPVFQYTPLNCLQTPNSPPPTTGPIMRAGSLF